MKLRPVLASGLATLGVWALLAACIDWAGVQGEHCLDAPGGCPSPDGPVPAKCATGLHVCQARCVPDDDPLTCGDRCEPCEAPAGRVAICQNRVCALCPEPELRCGNACCRSAALTAGGENACVLTDVGGVFCWGGNSRQQLKLPPTVARSARPVEMAHLAQTASAISAGEAHLCALVDGGVVRCWGSNDHAELGGWSSPEPPERPTTLGTGWIMFLRARTIRARRTAHGFNAGAISSRETWTCPARARSPSDARMAARSRRQGM